VNKKYLAYIRVSTLRQGERGVSLPEQKEAIERYAKGKNLEISRWFEGRETASKVGRPVFNEMLRLLRRNQAKGVIIHKIDRSARNLKDWAEIGQLVEAGIEVHFATESLDLTSPGGMLSADVQAVMSAYYSRNLREEVKKGFYGRLKQGFYPMPAPLGYLDSGAGKAKVPDPQRAPLIQHAFELYATGKYSQVELAAKLYHMGLRAKNGKAIQKNLLGRMLRNSFYIGLIQIEKTGQSFLGAHRPLVSKRLFDQVKAVLDGNFAVQRAKHDFPFRQMFSCKLCGKSLIPEKQKGHIYYRCQTKSCPTKCVRQEPVEAGVIERLKAVQLDPEQHEYLARKIEAFRKDYGANRSKEIDSLEIRVAQIKERLGLLTDAYLDGTIEKDIFEQRKTTLLMERRHIEDQIQDLMDGSPVLDQKLDRLLELLKSAYSLYICGLPQERREAILDVCSNRTLCEKTLDITLAVPFDQVVDCRKNTSGGPSRANARTWDKLAEFIFNFARKTAGQQGVKS
jgi:DNA invertase Pin-like site-specific DNA recombinase